MDKPAFESLSLSIEKFIFHVVHHGEDEPILMDDTPIEGFEKFFKKRILEILNGNKFSFLEDSYFLSSIKKVQADDNAFIEISKQLATAFHSHGDNRIKAGVMILMKIVLQDELKYILIKYDHEEVITYLQDGNKAILQEIKNTFSKSKEALQKAVVIDIKEDPWVAYVIDKSDLSNITKFFKGFLGVARKYSDEDLTNRVKEAYINTVRKNKSSLPGDYTSNASTIFYKAVQAKEVFETEDFLNTVFNTHLNSSIKKDFEKELKNKNIFGETFKYNKSIKKPRQRKYRTEEGVVIQFPSDAEKTVVIKNQKEQTIVTITTLKLHEENP